MPSLSLIGATLPLLALPGLFMGGRALRQRHPLRAGLWLGAATLLTLLGILLFLLANQLHTYHRLTFEQPVAQLLAHELSPQHFRVIVDDGQRIRLFTLRGDQWRLDAQVLVWQGPARLLGLDANYRLERLSGRYRDPELERHAPRSVYDLRPPSPLPPWLTLPLERLPWADTRYGSSTYLDLEDQAHYTIHLTPTGLIARRLD